jgi:hypothetical protein
MYWERERELERENQWERENDPLIVLRLKTTTPRIEREILRERKVQAYYDRVRDKFRG